MTDTSTPNEGENPSLATTAATSIASSKDAVKMEIKLDLALDPEKLRCITSKEGLSTTITVIT